MNLKKRGLGRGLSDLGLSALLGDMQAPATEIDTPPVPASVATQETTIGNSDGQLKMLPITILSPGKYQPRKIIAPDALEELANSIRAQGVIQPIVVRPVENNRYEIIAGERRWRAAQLAELTYIPAIVRAISDETAMIMALIENIQRRDLNVMEEATALNRLLTEFNLTHQEIADSVGKSRTQVTNLLRLLNLSATVRELVECGQLEMGHARALLPLTEVQQNTAANMIVSRALSVRDTENLIRKMSVSHKENNTVRSQSIILHTLQERLQQKFGAKVSVMQNTKGRGKLIISFQNEAELEKILAKFNHSIID